MENSSDKDSNTEKIEFKKPVLTGRISKLPKKAKPDTDKAAEHVDNSNEIIPEQTNESIKSSLPPAVLLKELSTPIPYKEPKWSGICPDGKCLLCLLLGQKLNNIVSLDPRSHRQSIYFQ